MSTIYQVMFSAPSDVETEQKAFFESVETCNRLFSIAGKQVRILPLHWKNDAIPGIGRPQEQINSQLVDQADALVAVFRAKFGTPTAEAESGTADEIKRALMKRLPLMVCFFEGRFRPQDSDEIRRILAFKASLADALLFEGYKSATRLHARFTLWLFRHAYSGTWISHGADQPRLAQLLRVSDFLSGSVEELANILHTMAGTKADTLVLLERAHTLDAFAALTMWTVRVGHGLEGLLKDRDWLRDTDARFGHIRGSDISQRGTYILAVQERELYLEPEVRDRLEGLFERLGHL